METEVTIRPLVESDLAEADRILRLAFGTFIGLPNPEQFMGDADYFRTRWKTDLSAILAAEHNGRLIGSNFATNWGSFGFFGPLTVHPDYWGRGIAQLLLPPTMEIFRRRGSRHMGLFTFANSPKHMALYQKFDFWPRDLVAIMAKPVDSAAVARRPEFALYAKAEPAQQEELLAGSQEVSNAHFEGLDLRREIRALWEQIPGDTVFIFDAARPAAFAVCHAGAGSEAGSGVCYVKFAAVWPDSRAAANFARLLEAVESFAHAAGAKKIVAGVNLARREAFRELFSRGFRTEIQGVAMETGDASSGYNRAGTFILDDWR